MNFTNDKNKNLEISIDYIDKTPFDSVASLKVAIINYFKKLFTSDNDRQFLEAMIKDIDKMNVETVSEAKVVFIRFFRSLKEDKINE